jgi:SAM-dependent methyltransferase
MTTTYDISPVSEETVDKQRDQFIGRIMQSLAGSFEVFGMYMGYKLGFYRALAENPGVTADELARLTNCQARYVREWLEQQTVTGIIKVENKAGELKFSVPAGHIEVLTEEDSLNYLMPAIQSLVAAAQPVQSVLKAYRQGGGVPYSEYGDDFVEGQAGMNRAVFLKLLGNEWLPAIPDINARLRSSVPARIADIGCGAGWSSIGMAQSYPNARVDGFDLDEPSIEAAQINARNAGLGDRVNFAVRDAADPALAGQYDLVTAFECIHDMNQPVEALRTMRNLAGAVGAVIVMDERVGEAFTAEPGEMDWLFYGFSILHCLPVGMAEQPSAGTGTVMRTDTLRNYALQAGFSGLEVLPIEHELYRFYRLF